MAPPCIERAEAANISRSGADLANPLNEAAPPGARRKVRSVALGGVSRAIEKIVFARSIEEARERIAEGVLVTLQRMQNIEP